MEEKTYKLRALTSKDIFPVFTIISKIGVKEFKSCFESEAVQKMMSGKKANPVEVGMTIALEIGGVVMANAEKAEKDIYAFLERISGISKEELEAMPMSTFAEMIVDIIKKDEFADFFKVVLTLLK